MKRVSSDERKKKKESTNKHFVRLSRVGNMPSKRDGLGFGTPLVHEIKQFQQSWILSEMIDLFDTIAMLWYNSTDQTEPGLDFIYVL